MTDVMQNDWGSVNVIMLLPTIFDSKNISRVMSTVRGLTPMRKIMLGIHYFRPTLRTTWTCRQTFVNLPNMNLHENTFKLSSSYVIRRRPEHALCKVVNAA
jgi:hypothetical protein